MLIASSIVSISCLYCAVWIRNDNISSAFTHHQAFKDQLNIEGYQALLSVLTMKNILTVYNL